MKPCHRNRKSLACLALGELEAGPAQALRAHAENCAGCRQYLAEVSQLNRILAASGEGSRTEAQASVGFHQRVLRALRTEGSAPALSRRLSRGGPSLLDWRLGVAALGAAVLVLAALRFISSPRPPLSIVSLQSQTRLTLAAEAAPSFANYQMAADRSLNDLDDLLTRQANRPLPAVPVYRAGTWGTGE